MKKRTLVILGASSMLALGIAAPVAAAAADKDPKASHQQQLASALAKELGVDETKVSDALDKVREDKKADRPDRTPENAQANLKTRLDAAVKEGKLTQAEADAVLKAVEAGVLWGGHGHGQWKGQWNGHWNGSEDSNQTK
jgi:membrane-bound lytic murein transglycosylase B